MSRIMLMFLVVLLVVSCHSGDHPAGDSTASGADDHGAMQDITSLDIYNVKTPSDRLVTGGQLTQEQMVALHKQGYETFINLRPVEEEGTGWEEEFAAAEGISFTRIPVAGAAGVTRESAELLAEALGDGTSGAVVYCKSGNRVGALLALKAHFVDGRSAEDALQFGQDAGMKSLVPLVRDLLQLPESGA